MTEWSNVSPALKGALGKAGQALSQTPQQPQRDPDVQAIQVHPPGILLPQVTRQEQAGTEPTGTINMESPAPSLSAFPSATPNIKAPLGTVAGDTNARGKLLAEGPGVQNIYHDVTNSRLGQAHPFLGKLLGGAAQVGGDVGDLLSNAAPGIGREIPGTTARYNMKLGQANTALTQDLANQEKQSQSDLQGAQANAQNSEIPLHEAEAKKAQAETPTPEQIQANLEHTQAETTAALTPKKVEGEQPLGNVENLNATLQDRYQVLNPGKPLPAQYQLPANATQKDYDRIDKSLSGVETAQGTAEQRKQTQALREQALAAAAEAKAATAEGKGDKWVYGQDKDGNTVAGGMSQLKAMGAQNLTEIPAQEVRNITNARQAVRLSEKQGTEQHPETMGVEQLIDSLGKAGKLGLAASRINAFLSGGVGAEPGDDPRIMALLDKTDLLMTATMLAHFGASGGRSPQMLEHFLSMANAKKMNENTLKAGVLAITDYMKDRAMEPTNSTQETGASTSQQHKVGDAVKLNGKDVTIKKIYPDGTFDY